jgi:hypothetical protein
VKLTKRLARAPERQDVASVGTVRNAVTLKTDKQTVNVIESKGTARNNCGQGGNVVENKGSYACETGILLKRQVVSFRYVVDGMWYAAGGRW